MRYRFKSSARKELKRLPINVQRQVIRKLEFYIRTPNPLHFAEPLIDKRFGDFRFRIGDWRILCDREKGTIVILKIGNRKNIYK